MCLPCCEWCVRDPNTLFELGMKYKRKYEEHPLYGQEDAPITEEYSRYLSYCRKALDYLQRAADKGHKEAEFEFGRWSIEKWHDGYGRLYVKKAAKKGHLVATQMVITGKRENLARMERDLNEQLLG